MTDRAATATSERPAERIPPGMKLELGLSANAGDEDLQLALQLGLEYAPAPPFNSGRPELARPEVLEQVKATLARISGPRRAAIETVAGQAQPPA